MCAQILFSGMSITGPCLCVHPPRRRWIACRDLECRAFPVVLGLEHKERHNEALDLPRVKSGRWRIVEIKLGKPRTYHIPLLHHQLIAELNLCIKERVNTHLRTTHLIVLCSVAMPLSGPLLSLMRSEAECVGWSGARRDTWSNKCTWTRMHELRRRAQVVKLRMQHSLCSFLRLLFAIQWRAWVAFRANYHRYFVGE